MKGCLSDDPGWKLVIKANWPKVASFASASLVTASCGMPSNFALSLYLKAAALSIVPQGYKKMFQLKSNDMKLPTQFYVPSYQSSMLYVHRMSCQF